MNNETFFDWTQKQREGRNKYWAVLREVREEYYNDYKGVTDLTVRPTFHFYVEEKYGIAMGIDGAGDYTNQYTIVHPKKYLVFKIKFGL